MKKNFFYLIAEAGLGTLRKDEGRQMEVGRKNSKKRKRVNIKHDM